MVNFSVYEPLFGGALIGVAVTLMLLFNGRVTGISGIVAGSLTKPSREGTWRLVFLAGILAGGLFVALLNPGSFVNLSGRSFPIVAVAGLLVGYGTVLGSGCTSGHGICGLSRFSVRSMIATLTFMGFGFLTVLLARTFIEGSP